MIMPRIKLLLAMVTGFTLGVALCAAWFMARQPPAPPPAAISPQGNLTGEASPPRAESAALPWRNREVKRESRPGGHEAEVENPEEAELLQRRILALRNHEARTRALELSSRLGLGPDETASLEAMLLKEGSDGILEIPSVIDTWSKANLTEQQAQSYARYKESRRKDEAEAKALEEVHEMAKSVDLSEEQRDAIFKKKFGFYLQLAEYGTRVFTSPIVESRMDEAVITESRIAMPVFGTRFDDDILTEAQAIAYRQFNRKERELEELKAREQE
jgi:hypothetical protein